MLDQHMPIEYHQNMKMLNHEYHPKMEDLLQNENRLVYKKHRQYHHHFVLAKINLIKQKKKKKEKFYITFKSISNKISTCSN